MKRLISWILGLIGLIVGTIFLGPWFFVGGIVVILASLFLLFYYVLAPENRWGTFVKESTAKIIVKGDKFDKVLIQMEGFTFDYKNPDPVEKWNIISGKETHPFGGLRIYSLLYPLFDVYIYKFHWTGVDEEGKLNTKEEWLDYVLLKDDVYWCMVDGCEDKNLLNLRLELLLTVRIVNPYKAIFRVQKWLETIINRTKPFIRAYITQDEYKNWITQKDVLGDKLKDALEKSVMLKEFNDSYGVEIKKIEVKEINPPDGYREKTLAPYLAELEKSAAIIKAEGEKQATILKAEGEKTAKVLNAEGEAERTKKVYQQIQDFGDTGKLIRALEAAEKSTLAAGVTIVPGLAELLHGFFGKPAESVISQEFKELKEKIEQLLTAHGK